MLRIAPPALLPVLSEHRRSETNAVITGMEDRPVTCEIRVNDLHGATEVILADGAHLV